MRAFVLVIFFLFGLSFCGQPQKSPNQNPYSLETLAFLEEILLDAWESPKTRESALSRLSYVCRTQDSSDGFLCYTWGLLEYQSGNYAVSYTAFRKALETNPSDSLYKNMLRISAEKSGNLKDLEAWSEEGALLSRFTRLQKDCREQKAQVEDFVFLAKAGVLTKESIQKGMLNSCFMALPTADKSLVAESYRSFQVSYKEKLLKDQVNSDPFSKLWDTSEYHESQWSQTQVPIVRSTEVSSLGQSWKKVTTAAQTGNESVAREALKEFQKELLEAKKKGKPEGRLALALERSAKLLLEQDPKYAKLRNLAKEL